MKISKFKVKMPKLNIEKKDLVLFLITFLFAGFIGFIALFSTYSIVNSIALACAIGLLFAILIFLANRYILSGVTYPTVKSLLELTVYAFILTAVIAIISLGLDLFFVKIKELILN